MLALLFGALGLLAAAPAWAQTPVVQFKAATYEVAEDAGNQDNLIIMTINPAASAELEVRVTSSGDAGRQQSGSQCGTNDLFFTDGVKFVTAGATEYGLVFTPCDDSEIEGDETFTLTINSGTGYTVGTQSTTTVTIKDNDSPPAAPTSLSVTPGNGQLSLSWTAPTGTLTGYDVHYTSAVVGTISNTAAVQTGASLSAADGWVAVDRGTENSPPTASQTISSLSNDTAYRVRVRAKNANGDGAWAFDTGTPTAQTTTPPTPVLNLLTGLTISDGTNDLPLQPNVANAVGLGGPGIYAVHVNLGIREIFVTPTFTEATVDARTYAASGGAGGTSQLGSQTWGSTESGTTKSLPLLSYDGVTRLRIEIGSALYQIYVYHNDKWESVNARLRQLKMLTN